MEEELTLGQQRVGFDFNPSQKEVVKNIKEKTAELIDLIEKLRVTNPSEQSRLISIAQTSYEVAAMWAVKAATA